MMMCHIPPSRTPISHCCQLWQIGLYHLRWKPEGESEREADGAEACEEEEEERGSDFAALLADLVQSLCGAAIEFPSKPFP